MKLFGRDSVLISASLALLVLGVWGSECTGNVTSVLSEILGNFVEPEELVSYAWGLTYSDSYFIDAVGTSKEVDNMYSGYLLDCFIRNNCNRCDEGKFCWDYPLD
ncbi:unnamed protein product [Moneuplotes crassus]|uniref:Uncharacterized protein n=1 Tax=Euplotes crassus TaxID=5936 RepID=A0AAD1UDU2_EUPCR|nr:unnamed protein product [Moneuplotes crassus]